ncbi:MAG: pyridoxamine 5'-phosphate oxidase family protein [Terriglobales bacterium]
MTAKKKKRSTRPQRGRPAMPAGYQTPKGMKGMMSWPAVEKKIEAAHNYWICTTRPDGRPHSMPVWGVWHDGAVYFATDAGSRKARNLKANPAMLIHLELDREVVILEGVAEKITDRAVLKQLDAPYARKYKMKVSTAPGEMFLVCLRPQVVLAWTEKQFASSPTRFTFT